AVDPKSNNVYVADPRNRRIQVFDSEGQFLAKWSVPEWGEPHGFEDLALDPKTDRLYASSANMDSVPVFDGNGKRLGSVAPNPHNSLGGRWGSCVVGGNLYVQIRRRNGVMAIDL